MKTKTLIAALLMGIAVVACAQKPGNGTGADISKGQIDTVSYLLGINFGSFMKSYDFGDVNYAELKKGMEDFVNSKGNPSDPEFLDQFKISPELMNDAFNSYLEKRRSAVLSANKEKEEAFLAANKAKSGVVETASGLQYKIIAPGSDVKPGPTDAVKVYYKGTLLDGTVFDERSVSDGDPIELTLDRVIPGWTEGIQLIGEGGEIELYIPAALGYGESGTQGIEPNSTLIFNVKLSEIVPAEAAE